MGVVEARALAPPFPAASGHPSAVWPSLTQHGSHGRASMCPSSAEAEANLLSLEAAWHRVFPALPRGPCLAGAACAHCCAATSGLSGGGRGSQRGATCGGGGVDARFSIARNSCGITCGQPSSGDHHGGSQPRRLSAAFSLVYVRTQKKGHPCWREVSLVEQGLWGRTSRGVRHSHDPHHNVQHEDHSPGNHCHPQHKHHCNMGNIYIIDVIIHSITVRSTTYVS